MDVRTVDRKIEGMTCSSCVATLERTLNSVPGVSATINFATESAHVTIPENVDAEYLINTIQGSGYRASILSLSKNDLLTAPNIGWRLTLAIVFAIPTIMIAMVSALHERIDKNIKYYSGNGQFLDVGFGLGVHLYMAQKLGYKVYGTELDSDCINFVTPYLPDAQLFSGDLLSANYENNYFDLINICHVIEHLIDPNSYLAELNRIVKMEGLIIVSTPNIGAIAYKLYRAFNFINFRVPLIVDGLEHTVIFNNANLKKAIQAHGFEIVQQYNESVNDSFRNIWKSNLSTRKKIVRYLQTFVKVNQVVIAKKCKNI